MKKIVSVGITVLCLLFGSAACAKPGEDVTKEPEKMEELRVVLMGNPPEQGMEEIYSQLDAMTTVDLGCTVRFEFVPWGNEREQLNILAASGEYDLLPGGIFSDYKQLINKNAFLDLNQYLNLVPDLIERYRYFSETALEECEIAGGLYGLP